MSVTIKKAHLILLLAGQGTRLYDSVHEKKQFILVNSLPLFLYSLNSFIESNIFKTITLVISKDDKKRVISFLEKLHIDTTNIDLIVGGETRNQSVKNALISLENKASDDDKIFIHDAARPLITKQTILDIYNKSLECDALTPIMKIYDSIIYVEDKIEYVNRDNYFKVATPQVFTFSLIKKAYQDYDEKKTDDFSKIIDMNKYNCKTIIIPSITFKITDENDLKVFKALISKKG